MRRFGADLIQQILCFALYLPGVNRSAIGHAMDMPSETVTSIIKALKRDGLASFEAAFGRRFRTTVHYTHELEEARVPGAGGTGRGATRGGVPPGGQDPGRRHPLGGHRHGERVGTHREREEDRRGTRRGLLPARGPVRPPDRRHRAGEPAPVTGFFLERFPPGAFKRPEPAPVVLRELRRGRFQARADAGRRGVSFVIVTHLPRGGFFRRTPGRQGLQTPA